MDDALSMTAIILAGGKSSRMGRDKALLKFRTKTILEHLVDFTCARFSETLVIINQDKELSGLDLKGADIYEDLIQDSGPLAGLYTGLVYSKNLLNCVFTCDMPFVNDVIVQKLVERWEAGLNAVCFKELVGSYQPFPGVYHRSSRSLIKSLLESGKNSMYRFFEIADVKSVVLPQERIEVLTNMNDMGDYHRALEQMEQFDAFSS